MPRISVILPFYNAERFLAKAIESVLWQTFSDFELLLIDDGSSDKSTKIADAAAAGDHRVILIGGKDRGLSDYFVREKRCDSAKDFIRNPNIAANLNVGLQLAKGELIARMDADDICAVNRFEQQIRFLDQHPEYCAVGTQAMRIDPDGLPISVWRVPEEHEEIDAQHIHGKPGGIIHPSVMIRRNALERIGGYRSGCDLGEDYDLFLRLAEIGRLGNLSEVLLLYRLHEKSITLSCTVAQNKATDQVLIEAWSRRQLRGAVPSTVRVQRTASVEELAWYWARAAFAEHNFRTARKHSYRLLRKHPGEMRRWLLFGASCFGPVAHFAKRILPYSLGSLESRNV